ncbi:MAG TPA: site-specific DNA-methyltransferase [Clostridia bacterium]|nr:site-specific DNA-methyltransferase [Clostridia bacterium]
MESESADTGVTSPPYYGLRDYGVDGQIGLEETPEAYISRLVAVFHEFKRVLRDDGTLWVNIGDSYAGSGKGQTDNGCADPKNTKTIGMDLPVWKSAIPPKNLIGIPWMLAFALRADGWYLRQEIIWAKPNPMPKSVTDRCTKSHESIFLLSKQPRYYFDAAAIRQPMAESSKTRGPVDFGGSKGRHYSPPPTDPNFRNGHEQWGRTYNYTESNADGRCNKRDVWTVSTTPCKEAHFATYPKELIEPCILAGSRKGGLVVDMFCGSGTTGIVALSNERRFCGIELNTAYARIAEKRIMRETDFQNKMDFERGMNQ